MFGLVVGVAWFIGYLVLLAWGYASVIPQWVAYFHGQ